MIKKQENIQNKSHAETLRPEKNCHENVLWNFFPFLPIGSKEDKINKSDRFYPKTTSLASILKKY